MGNSLYKKPVTLVELFALLSIVCLLTSTILLGFGFTKTQQEEVKRHEELRQLENALHAYFAEFNAYPSTNGSWFGVSTNGGNRGTTGAHGYIPNLAPLYIDTLPEDPSGEKSGWSGYQYRSDGKNFKLISHTIGPKKFPRLGEAFYDPARPIWALMICSGEPACSTW